MAKPTAVVTGTTKLKLLCLHGYLQNSEVGAPML